MGRAKEGGNLVDSGLRRVHVKVSGDDMGTFLGEQNRGLEADAAGVLGDTGAKLTLVMDGLTEPGTLELFVSCRTCQHR